MQGSTPQDLHQDKLVFYASVFVYNPKLKAEYRDYSPSLTPFESTSLNHILI